MVYSYYSKNDIQLDFNHFSTITQSSPREDLSNKYSFISTSRVLETLEKEGWKPSNIQEASTINGNNKGFQKHLIRLRNPNFTLKNKEIFILKSFSLILIMDYRRSKLCLVFFGKFV